MAQEVKITIGVDGGARVEVKGVKGIDCQDLTRELEAALGKVEKSQLTGEYYHKETPARLKQRGQ